MVRALLAGTKTQTRRVLQRRGLGACDHREFPNVPEGPWKMDGSGFTYCMTCGNGVSPSNNFKGVNIRFAVGDRLYVREAWRSEFTSEGVAPRDLAPDSPIEYIAGGVTNLPERTVHFGGRHRQAMHMPRWASRLILIVTEVRVQRLQEISAEDARDEGVDRRSPMVRQMWLFGADKEARERIYLQACPWEYEVLWNKLNADRGFGWDTNPWVVAVTFTVEHRNIDRPAP
ncbi:MAG: hypothetical protein EOR91_01335 [Mesorhizobium sp.]|nr:MAG: hypothetical protein EOR91_01335 [Mesorhizobium sp.]